ncbi:MAG: bifunctional diaminohydroxyphosphoribosylaminopyrimidine deaminase/5-amino-6-(5-phosphoribosylamino)uracil reductase RibD [Rhodothermales bacterium]
MPPVTEHDDRWMRRCLELAARGAGQVSPNPMVGSVLVGADGQLLGEGWHERYGEAHAERNAIRDAERRHPGLSFEDATLYVNLEPCNHQGKTPPCTDILLEKRIGRVVVGMIDPFPAVAGAGVARLEAHGVRVCVGVLEAECRRFNEAFVHHIRTGKPLVTLKLAQTLDGSIATATGDARWVSGEASRALVHRWRAELDAVLVGAGTALADDPALTVRHVEGRQPVRVVLDREGVLPASLHLFSDRWAGSTVAMIATPADAPAYAEALRAAGGRLVRIPERDGHLDLHAALAWLGAEGGPAGRRMTSLLVEAGPGLATALLGQDLVDRLAVFVAPKLVGGGLPAFGSLGIDRMADALVFPASRWEPVGEDMLFLGYRR